MTGLDGATATISLELPDEAATGTLAARLAKIARLRDVFALAGELGAGKTVFARAFIRVRGGGEEVPSPTFTLVQAYELADGTVYHFDLFRLNAAEDAYELGIEEAFAEGISLIEWPEQLGGLLPPDSLMVALAHGPTPDARHATLSGGGTWPARLAEAGLG